MVYNLKKRRVFALAMETLAGRVVTFTAEMATVRLFWKGIIFMILFTATTNLGVSNWSKDTPSYFYPKTKKEIVLHDWNIDWTETHREEKTKLAYDFFGIQSFSRWIDLARVSELTKEEFEKNVLRSLPSTMRPKLRPYLSFTIRKAKHYGVDPFWVLSIMWTESHFNRWAKSYVGARGLMQIMPATGEGLAKRIGRRVKNGQALRKLLYNPFSNIEMGILYLKKLRDYYKSHRLATVAYNMGIGNVNYRLRKKLQVGVKNLYLSKVRKSYTAITQEFKHQVMKSPYPYQYTLAVKGKYFLGKIERTDHYADLMNFLKFLDIQKYLRKPKLKVALVGLL